MRQSIRTIAFAQFVACGSSSIVLRDPSTVATNKSLVVGEPVCWVEPKWMYPGPTDCHGYSDPAPGVPKCTTTKPQSESGRTYSAPGFDYDPDLTARARKSEPLACCYRCADKLHDLGE